jgi:acetoin utilization protein AcuC
VPEQVATLTAVGKERHVAGRDGQKVALVWDDALASYDFGDGHPLAPIRVELTVDLIRETGLVARPNVIEVAPPTLDEDELLRVHRETSSGGPAAVQGPGDPRGLGPRPRAGDNPVFGGMHEASLLVCAASAEAARQVWEGEADHAFNPAGGLHHAMPDRAAGFCIYNDPAVAIDWLLEHGAERVCYVDVDVHHGDGVEVMFADDPRVLTISLHESGRFLFPGTGASDDIGGRRCAGQRRQPALPPRDRRGDLAGRFDAVVDPLIRAFAPTCWSPSSGCDTHATDPLAHLALTVDDIEQIVARLHALAHEVCEGKWVATGGGGYQLVTVVPRAWTLAFAEMVGASLPVDIPMPWQEPRQAAEEAVAHVRHLVLPRHGAR